MADIGIFFCPPAEQELDVGLLLSMSHLTFFPCTCMGLDSEGSTEGHKTGQKVLLLRGLAYACPWRSYLRKGSLCECSRGPGRRIMVHWPSMASTKLSWVCGLAQHLATLHPTSRFWKLWKLTVGPKEGMSALQCPLPASSAPHFPLHLHLRTSRSPHEAKLPPLNAFQLWKE